VRINADFSKRVVVGPNDYRWVDSPMQGVERMMLDRVGEEVARATSLVRYAPNTAFSPHVHGGGEEFLVLEGIFADEFDSYPKGTYVRSPIGTGHSPKIGQQGCTIFVKLHQFETDDRQPVIVNTLKSDWRPGVVPGLKVLSLHEYGGEHVALVNWAPNTEFKPHIHHGGEEVFVIKGTFYDEHGEYPTGTWIRSPHGSKHTPYTRGDGALIYVKVGHL
jgi:anti-sigma factor ChrR (cupin superfamily)